MANPYVNKVEFGGQTLIDLTQDTVTANDVAEGVYFHLPSGQRTVGTGSGGGVDPSDLEIVVSPSSATGTAQTGTAQTEAPNYIPGGDITAPELDYEFKDGKLYIYGIKRPLFIGSGVKLIIKDGLTSNVVGVGAADYMRI